MITMNDLLWGIDLGGTKIEGVVIAREGNVLARQRVPTERDKGYDHIIQQIVKLIELLSQTVGHTPAKIGIGTPGAIDPYSGLMKNSNTTVLNGQPFDQDLATAIGIPLRMANDANCFAIAETRLGAAKEYSQQDHVVFGVIMGTGVGGGVVINGQVWDGGQGIGGEWGHNYLDKSGGMCYCGKVGCTETLISGTGLERYYQQISGQSKRLATIIDEYEKGQADEYSQATVKRLIHFFGKGIASIVNMLDPTAIVIGGGLSRIELLYGEGIKEVEKHAFNPKLYTPILRPKLGDSAGVFGAAMLVR